MKSSKLLTLMGCTVLLQTFLVTSAFANPVDHSIRMADAEFNRTCFSRRSFICNPLNEMNLQFKENKLSADIETAVLNHGGKITRPEPHVLRYVIAPSEYPKLRPELLGLAKTLEILNVSSQSQQSAEAELRRSLKPAVSLGQCAQVSLSSNSPVRLIRNTHSLNAYIETPAFLGSGGAYSAVCSLELTSAANESEISLADWNSSKYLMYQRQEIKIEFRKNSSDDRLILSCGPGSNKYPMNMGKIIEQLKLINVNLECLP
jgi:hypothetical protein